MGATSVVLDFMVAVLTALVTVFAGIRSFRAIESTDKADDKQWLTFWLMYALFDGASIVLDFLGRVIPFYGFIKLAIIVFLGFFGGAAKIYPIFAPFLLKADKAAQDLEQKAMKKKAELSKKN